MTTDQRCPECHFIEKHLASCSRQPAPTSSLEEARKRAERDYDVWLEETRGHIDLQKWRSVMEEAHGGHVEGYMHGEAAARAEVIREVEALRRDEIAWIPDTVGREAMAATRGWNSAVDAVLRALSQGGEGKGQ